MAAFKHHLGTHFHKEMMSCTKLEGDGYFYCRLCSFKMVPQDGKYDTARHVAVRHNYLLTLYHDELARPAPRPATAYVCELCNFSTPRLHEFLYHITYSYMEPTLSSAGFFTQPCSVCGVQIDTYEGYIEHVGLTTQNCNYSLCEYFRQVDASRSGSIADPVRLSVDRYLARLRESAAQAAQAVALDRRPPGLFPSKNVLQDVGPNFLEDPVSCEIKMDIAPYEGHCTVEFARKLPMKSFKTAKKFETQEVPSCVLCPLYRGTWDIPEGDSRAVMDAFLIHLANTHFKTELERMFVSSSGPEDFQCCRESFNYQTLIGHVKEAHSVIQNMYKAVAPITYPSMNLNNLNKKVQDPQFVSHLMPWLPKSFQSIKRVTKHVAQTGMICKLCNTRIPGNKTELNKHYIDAHFQQEIEAKYSQHLRIVPYRCPEKDCRFVTQGQIRETQQKEELFLHLANRHKLAEQLLNSSISSVERFRQNKVQYIKPEVSIKPELEDVKEVSTTSYVNPRPLQCLVCHVDQGNLFNLSHHMRYSRHVNTSWALQSNSQFRGDLSSTAGLWFQKLDVSYRCSHCVKKAAVNMSVNNFHSLEEVFVHVCTYHREYFENKYPETVLSFCMCKVCNGFINLQGCDTEEEKRQVEYTHYLTHGGVFIAELGIVKKRMLKFYFCSLCSTNTAFKSWEFFQRHLTERHQSQVLSSFRDFNLAVDLKPLAACCVCKQGDNSLEHLAAHSKQILVGMGLVESTVKDHKSSRVLCRCCGFVDKNLVKILEHFSRVHQDLFTFIQHKFNEQNEAMDQEIAVPVKAEPLAPAKPNPVKHQQSLLKNTVKGDLHRFHYFCDLCATDFGLNPLALKKHLISKHYGQEILDHVSELAKTRMVCPECGLSSETILLHYWIEHIVKKGEISFLNLF